MPEDIIQISVKVPVDLVNALDAEGDEQLRDRTGQLTFILRERYANHPKLQDKQKAGSLRK